MMLVIHRMVSTRRAPQPNLIVELKDVAK